MGNRGEKWVFLYIICNGTDVLADRLINQVALIKVTDAKIIYLHLGACQVIYLYSLGDLLVDHDLPIEHP